jgi:hypothetical protein
MPVELSGVILGSCIGLVGVALGHALTSGRDRRARRIAGLQDVQRELLKRERLALDITQHINTAGYDGAKLFQLQGWKECSLTLQEKAWKTACITYLPEAIRDFQTLDSKIWQLMDADHSQDKTVVEIQECMEVIANKIARSISACV